MSPNLKDRLKPNADIAEQRSGEELVLVLPHSGRVKVLNATGAFIWQYLKQQYPLEAVADLLCREFEVEAQQARQDTLEFARMLLERGLASLV